MPAKKRGADGKEKYTTAEVKSQCVDYFKKMATKKKATDAEKQEAQVALATYNQIGFQEKAEFARTFFNRKGTKDFNFVKEYAEKLKATKTTAESTEENYFTRIYVVVWNVKTRA